MAPNVAKMVDLRVPPMDQDRGKICDSRRPRLRLHCWDFTIKVTCRWNHPPSRMDKLHYFPLCFSISSLFFDFWIDFGILLFVVVEWENEVMVAVAWVRMAEAMVGCKLFSGELKVRG
ncbi:hypothetical protein V6N11_050255 [Hibiscus sabdariffa]|uniref:Uncharacterized protein n=1 Tax=Hibiscus sabdariffa TaxID=183260 RepID=A0ABR2T9B8_9ROSI